MSLAIAIELRAWTLLFTSLYLYLSLSLSPCLLLILLNSFCFSIFHLPIYVMTQEGIDELLRLQHLAIDMLQGAAYHRYISGIKISNRDLL